MSIVRSEKGVAIGGCLMHLGVYADRVVVGIGDWLVVRAAHAWARSDLWRRLRIFNSFLLWLQITELLLIFSMSRVLEVLLMYALRQPFNTGFFEVLSSLIEYVDSLRHLLKLVANILISHFI